MKFFQIPGSNRFVDPSAVTGIAQQFVYVHVAVFTAAAAVAAYIVAAGVIREDPFVAACGGIIGALGAVALARALAHVCCLATAKLFDSIDVADRHGTSERIAKLDAEVDSRLAQAGLRFRRVGPGAVFFHPEDRDRGYAMVSAVISEELAK